MHQDGRIQRQQHVDEGVFTADADFAPAAVDLVRVGRGRRLQGGLLRRARVCLPLHPHGAPPHPLHRLPRRGEREQDSRHLLHYLRHIRG